MREEATEENDAGTRDSEPGTHPGRGGEQPPDGANARPQESSCTLQKSELPGEETGEPMCNLVTEQSNRPEEAAPKVR